MQKTKLVTVAVVVLAVAAGLWWMSSVRKPGEPGSKPATTQQEPEPLVPGGTKVEGPKPVGAVAKKAALKAPPVAANPVAAPSLVLTGEVVKVRSDFILAGVNGVAITLKDLMPVSATAATERSMGADMFKFLLNRAIEREVAFQTAEANGVRLGEEQLQQLETIRARALEKDPNSFTDVHDDFTAKAEFDVRDFSGLMTQEALLAAAGGPPKYVTPEMVQEYYESHRSQYGELPEDPDAKQQAWQGIDVEIRNQMASQVTAEHQSGLEAMMADLVAQVQVDRFVAPAEAKPR